MKKRLVAVLLTGAMVCSMASISTVTALAADEETAEDVEYVDPDVYKRQCYSRGICNY